MATRSTPFYVGFYFRDNEVEVLAVNKGTIRFAVSACDPSDDIVGKTKWADDGTGKAPKQRRTRWELVFIPFENNLKNKDDAIKPNINQIPWLFYVLRSTFLQIQGTNQPGLARVGTPSAPNFPTYFNYYSLPRRVVWDGKKPRRVRDHETGTLGYKIVLYDYNPSYDEAVPTPWAVDWNDVSSNTGTELINLGIL